MSVFITLAVAVAAIEGFSNEFKVERVSRDSKNLKVEFSDIRESAQADDNGASADEVKYTKLIRLARALREQGIPASISSAWDTGTKDEKGNRIYVPWPALYINNEARTNAERNKVTAETNARMDKLESMVANLVTALSGKTTVVEPTVDGDQQVHDEPKVEGRPEPQF